MKKPGAMPPFETDTGATWCSFLVTFVAHLTFVAEASYSLSSRLSLCFWLEIFSHGVREFKNQFRLIGLFNSLLLYPYRNNCPDDGSDAFVTKSGPKRSRSFYDSVVESMLGNKSNDITSTHYSSRRSRIRSQKESEVNQINVDDSFSSLDSSITEKELQKENILPEWVFAF